MLTPNQIVTATCVLHVLEQEGATFTSTMHSHAQGLSAKEVSQHFVDIAADVFATVVSFREEAVCFSIEFANDELASCPADCIERAMIVRRTLVNMPESN